MEKLMNVQKIVELKYIGLQVLLESKNNDKQDKIFTFKNSKFLFL